MSGLQLPQPTVPFQKHSKFNTVNRLLVGKSTKKPPYNLCYCLKGEVLGALITHVESSQGLTCTLCVLLPLGSPAWPSRAGLSPGYTRN